jgi:hypothetical protein
MTLILSGTDGLSDVDGSAATPAIRGTDANTGIFFPSADVIAFSEGGVEAMRMDANGDLLAGTTDTSFFSGSNRGVGLYGSNGFIAASRSNAISGLFNRFGSDGEVIQLRRNGTSVGTLGVSATGVTMTGTNGITFTGTQTASADANTLDDYEEGTWTPAISGDGTLFAGTTYTARQGNYVKIGRQVTVMFDIGVSVVGTRTGNASVNGLPFPIQNTADLSGGGGSLGLCQNLASAFVYQGIYPQNNSSFLYILAKTGAGSDSFILSSTSFYQNNTRITGCVTYITTT